METVSTVILIVLFLIAYANYRAGGTAQLKQWLGAKFVNSAAPKSAAPTSTVVSA